MGDTKALQKLHLKALLYFYFATSYGFLKLVIDLINTLDV